LFPFLYPGESKYSTKVFARPSAGKTVNRSEEEMNTFLFILKVLLYGWILSLIELIRIICARCRQNKRREGESEREKRAARVPCIPITHAAFVRPDPLIYSQHHLFKLGIAVTWDNPDIELFLNGVLVSSKELQPATTYEIRARIWNNSFTAPVVLMPVHFSYLDFGVANPNVPISSTKVDVGVKGGPNHPAFAAVPWTTPAQAGVYCIQVKLEPPDDLNWENNLGQENTKVGQSNSPVEFTFKLRNDTDRERRYRFEVDTYSLLLKDPCLEEKDERERERLNRLKQQAPGNFPIPVDWTVEIVPDTPVLAVNDEITIIVTITPPQGFVGTKDFNVNAFHDGGMAGGVTLKVVGS